LTPLRGAEVDTIPVRATEIDVENELLCRLSCTAGGGPAFVEPLEHAHFYRKTHGADHWLRTGVRVASTGRPFAQTEAIPVSGLGAIEQFKRKGFNVLAYEARETVGGLW
jgi:hypothetical protein